MYYVYILKHPRRSKVYIGYSDDLERRMKEHKKDKPGWILIYYEAYKSKGDAQKREQMLKQYGSSLSHLKKRLKYSLI